MLSATNQAEDRDMGDAPTSYGCLMGQGRLGDILTCAVRSVVRDYDVLVMAIHQPETRIPSCSEREYIDISSRSGSSWLRARRSDNLQLGLIGPYMLPHIRSRLHGPKSKHELSVRFGTLSSCRR